jgi:hypothetical protein
MKKFIAFTLFAFTGTAAAQVAYSEDELSFLGLTKDDLVAVAHGGPLPEGAAEVFTAFYEDALAGFDVKAHDQLEKETILASKLYSSFRGHIQLFLPLAVNLLVVLRWGSTKQSPRFQEVR